MAVVIWHMLSANVEFNPALMVDKKLAKKADMMKKDVGNDSDKEEKVRKPVRTVIPTERLARKALKDTGVAGRKKRPVRAYP